MISLIGLLFYLITFGIIFLKEVEPICDKSVTEWTIDSTVVVNNRLYIFIDWFVIEVNLTDKSDSIRYNITQLIDFKDKEFSYRVDIAFTLKPDSHSNANLILIANVLNLIEKINFIFFYSRTPNGLSRLKI